jgi:hypothetical protein
MKSWMSRSSEPRIVSGLGRSVFALAAVCAALLIAGPAAAQARFNRIVIDTRPVADSGTRQLAENIRPMLAAGVMRAMGSSIDPRDRKAPTLVITVKSLQLAAFGGNDDGGDGFRFGGGGMSSSDYLDTVVSVVQGGKVVSSFPMLIHQPSSAAGPWFVQPNEDRRVVQLGDTLGQWVRQKVGG